MTVKDVIGRTVHWCVFDGGTQLGGAMWFIQALFQVSILYALVEFILQRLLHGADTLLPQGLFSGVLLWVGWRCGLAGWNVWGLGICGQLLLPVLPGHGPAAHDAGKHTGVPARYFCRSGLCGAADSGATRLCGSGGQWIQQPDFPAGYKPGGLGAGAGGRVPDRSPALYPRGAGLSGRATMPIVILHFLSFKLVTWLGLLATGGEPYLLAAFPIYFTGGAWWLAYTAAGLVLPLAANAVYKKIKNTVLAH